ncbi:hypothetical protein BESB_080320 [Besnoitia besnoiti]|uniref:Uncharacterized protein n=1 Tax=Besnoitia besnoiti TaxID=94643 RepID=A0A2A9MCZ4_BESBE|nr:hypothetical protein BESB_080320 [Besnoitia besnoiti]PFH33816.1 hypothetical protein BESB_080320 [Besnoitia besnoiti]
MSAKKKPDANAGQPGAPSSTVALPALHKKKGREHTTKSPNRKSCNAPSLSERSNPKPATRETAKRVPRVLPSSREESHGSGTAPPLSGLKPDKEANKEGDVSARPVPNQESPLQTKGEGSKDGSVGGDERDKEREGAATTSESTREVDHEDSRSESGSSVVAVGNEHNAAAKESTDAATSPVATAVSREKSPASPSRARESGDSAEPRAPASSRMKAAETPERESKALPQPKAKTPRGEAVTPASPERKTPARTGTSSSLASSPVSMRQTASTTKGRGGATTPHGSAELREARKSVAVPPGAPAACETPRTADLSRMALHKSVGGGASSPLASSTGKETTRQAPDGERRKGLSESSPSSGRAQPSATAHGQTGKTSSPLGDSPQMTPPKPHTSSGAPKRAELSSLAVAKGAGTAASPRALGARTAERTTAEHRQRQLEGGGHIRKSSAARVHHSGEGDSQAPEEAAARTLKSPAGSGAEGPLPERAPSPASADAQSKGESVANLASSGAAALKKDADFGTMPISASPDPESPRAAEAATAEEQPILGQASSSPEGPFSGGSGLQGAPCEEASSAFLPIPPRFFGLTARLRGATPTPEPLPLTAAKAAELAWYEEKAALRELAANGFLRKADTMMGGIGKSPARHEWKKREAGAGSRREVVGGSRSFSTESQESAGSLAHSPTTIRVHDSLDAVTPRARLGVFASAARQSVSKATSFSVQDGPLSPKLSVSRSPSMASSAESPSRLSSEAFGEDPRASVLRGASNLSERSLSSFRLPPQRVQVSRGSPGGLSCPPFSQLLGMTLSARRQRKMEDSMRSTVRQTSGETRAQQTGGSMQASSPFSPLLDTQAPLRALSPSACYGSWARGMDGSGGGSLGSLGSRNSAEAPPGSLPWFAVEGGLVSSSQSSAAATDVQSGGLQSASACPATLPSRLEAVFMSHFEESLGLASNASVSNRAFQESPSSLPSFASSDVSRCMPQRHGTDSSQGGRTSKERVGSASGTGMKGSPSQAETQESCCLPGASPLLERVMKEVEREYNQNYATAKRAENWTRYPKGCVSGSIAPTNYEGEEGGLDALFGVSSYGKYDETRAVQVKNARVFPIWQKLDACRHELRHLVATRKKFEAARRKRRERRGTGGLRQGERLAGSELSPALGRDFPILGGEAPDDEGTRGDRQAAASHAEALDGDKQPLKRTRPQEGGCHQAIVLVEEKQRQVAGDGNVEDGGRVARREQVRVAVEAGSSGRQQKEGKGESDGGVAAPAEGLGRERPAPAQSTAGAKESSGTESVDGPVPGLGREEDATRGGPDSEAEDKKKGAGSRSVSSVGSAHDSSGATSDDESVDPFELAFDTDEDDEETLLLRADCQPDVSVSSVSEDNDLVLKRLKGLRRKGGVYLPKRESAIHLLIPNAAAATSDPASHDGPRQNSSFEGILIQLQRIAEERPYHESKKQSHSGTPQSNHPWPMLDRPVYPSSRSASPAGLSVLFVARLRCCRILAECCLLVRHFADQVSLACREDWVESFRDLQYHLARLERLQSKQAVDIIRDSRRSFVCIVASLYPFDFLAEPETLRRLQHGRLLWTLEQDEGAGAENHPGAADGKSLNTASSTGLTVTPRLERWSSAGATLSPHQMASLKRVMRLTGAEALFLGLDQMQWRAEELGEFQTQADRLNHRIDVLTRRQRECRNVMKELVAEIVELDHVEAEVLEEAGKRQVKSPGKQKRPEIEHSESGSCDSPKKAKGHSLEESLAQIGAQRKEAEGKLIRLHGNLKQLVWEMERVHQQREELCAVQKKRQAEQSAKMEERQMAQPHLNRLGEIVGERGGAKQSCSSRATGLPAPTGLHPAILHRSLARQSTAPVHRGGVSWRAEGELRCLIEMAQMVLKAIQTQAIGEASLGEASSTERPRLLDEAEATFIDRLQNDREFGAFFVGETAAAIRFPTTAHT